MARVLVVDDSAVVRNAVRDVFTAHHDFEICGEAENGLEAIEKAAKLTPDLVILDLSMPVMNGLDAARVLNEKMPNTPIILFSVYSDLLRQNATHKAGIAALVSKNEKLGALVGTAQSLLDLPAD